MDGPDPDQVTRLSDEVSHVSLHTSRWLTRLAGIPGEIEDQFDICARQYLLAATLYTELQPSILLAVGSRPTGLAAPHHWRAYLQARGLRFRPAASVLRYGRVVLLHGVRGVSTAMRILIASLRGKLSAAPQQPYDVLMTLPPSLLSRGGNGPRESLVGWFADRSRGAPLWIETPTGVSELPANCTTVAIALPRLSGFGYLQFMIGSARALAAAIVGVMVGQPHVMLLLRDMVQLAHARALGPASMARNYAAENSQWIHRPLYTVWAERVAGSRAQLLFYATNMDESIRYGSRHGKPTFLPGYRIMSWSDYLVWDSHHADLVRAWGHDSSRIIIVGTVPLTDSGSLIPALPPRSVAIFDVAPFKPARLAKLGLVPPYYSARVTVDFLRQCQEAVRSVGGTLILKQKRDIGNHAHSSYRVETEILKASPDVLILDPGISARRLVEMCDAVVSMPFSSPGLFGRESGVPSALFDPTGTIVASERQRHGLPLLQGEPALRQWLADAFTADRLAESSGRLSE
ncbi:hypothetical protein ABIB57_004787 [Devosia sp. UYZn731]|uniref:polysaccharide biosynthesis PFTS motif protein n=1 Tax=Devosia sp. UYZn731 TaxID=3156345 RepID=UPI0033949A6E